jgi:3-oxoacyl-[acyl-carrier protein] reductase
MTAPDAGPVWSGRSNTDRQRFAGAVAFVTGGASGLGEALAYALSAEGAGVAVVDVDAAAAEAVAAAIRADGGRALAVPCDVADAREVERAVARTVEEFGGLDVLVNNAGLHVAHYHQDFGTLGRADLRALFDVNVFGVVHCTLACAAALGASSRAAVVNMASLAAFEPANPYGVSKLAVRGLTTAFARELAGLGIRVNAVAPGLVATSSAMVEVSDERVADLVGRRQLVHRLGSVDDVVSAVLFLCSAEAGFVTGATLRLDGGVFRGV